MKNKIGQVLESNSCGRFKILTESFDGKTRIQFLQTGYITDAASRHVLTGNVKDPYFPQVVGQGYFGTGRYSSRDSCGNKTLEYTAWKNMLIRCYDDNYQSRKAYSGVVVCQNWLNFQVFAEWYVPRRKVLDDMNILRPSLDKEILSENRKATLYSPETCCIIPAEINTVLGNQNRSKRNGLPKGITKTGQGYRVLATSYNSEHVKAKFNTIDECIAWRNNVDQEHYTFLANKYKSVLEIHVYSKLVNWDKF